MVRLSVSESKQSQNMWSWLFRKFCFGLEMIIFPVTTLILWLLYFTTCCLDCLCFVLSEIWSSTPKPCLFYFSRNQVGFIKFEVLASSLGGWFFEASVRLMMFIVFESRVQSQRPLDPSDNMQYWSNFPSNTSSDPTNFTSYCHGTVFYWKGAPGSL